ncbi:MAG: sodium ion-translocating decarboxylase subunit beta [Fretibacterium sp.]|uniref:sodium ion-translocating decarboxylase subunit beta n=1 Tax=Fretibacterium sp. OH1220_COT-178 TaxID=2491047 RepID=UPI000F5FF297|nr:sodium ion-translocating decarboxylase subunit beta [Fretibacterium sp. OH1220_COT-178]MDO4786746.1 sodium ion-translocating decarboxylase subunit beta [Fretibacterium sp.]RRD65791.1 sodium ion-translocating decarboxylase subunit beta [Fretibacterium sp. OH1220_COT-178]
MELFHGLSALTWQQVVMVGVGLLLIYLATVKEYEPSLLLPMGFGTLLVNIPLSSALTHLTGGGVEVGAISRLFEMGIQTELFPLLIFIAVGAMIDFTPLFQTPVTMIFGLMAQAGIFLTMGLAYATGFFDLKEAASIGIIGAADGPTSIYVANRFAPQLLGSISVAAYSYMALVPIIQPPVIRLLTTEAERRIAMPYHEKPVSKRKKVLFPILVTLISGFLVPASAALIGFLMFGNLLRESGVVDRLAKGAQNELANIVTILLGLAISTKMTGEDFLRPMTLGIMGLGLVAFVLDTAVGVVTAKVLNLFLRRKINPMIGAAGISAFPMSSRVIQKMATAADKNNFILMQAVGANVSGQIGSVLAGGLLMAILSAL